MGHLRGTQTGGWSVLFSPFIPLLFMGEEYDEAASFPYFISHLDPALVAAVRRGRRGEFAAFRWQGEPPDPQHETTFLQAKLAHTRRHTGYHRVLYDFYQELLRLRKALVPLAQLSKDAIDSWAMKQSECCLCGAGTTTRRRCWCSTLGW